MSFLDRLAVRRPDPEPVAASGWVVDDPLFATKALRKFLASLTAREAPVLLDLGPVVGSNVNFFGEQLGCKIFVEDIFANLDQHIRDQKLEELPAFLKKRLPQADGTVDGILCWDLFDYLDRASAQELATQLIRVLRPGGTLLGFFATTQVRECIIAPERTKEITDIIAAGTSQYGMQTFDQALMDLYHRELITYEEALHQAQPRCHFSCVTDRFNQCCAIPRPGLRQIDSHVGRFAHRQAQKGPRTSRF